jgi:predicted enzyme related to lactoylglutathione lyase
MAHSLTPMIVTKDVERLGTFYRDLLDTTESERYPPEGPAFYLGIAIGSGSLGLVSDDGAPDGPQRMLVSIEVDDVDALLGRVERLGGTVEGPPNDMPWGQRVAHVRDPDGNAVNLTTTAAHP